MITAEGGNKAWFCERAFHPITAGEHKDSPSKPLAAESLTCLKREREREKEREREEEEDLGSSALDGQRARPLSSAPQPTGPELHFTRPVLPN